MRIPPLTAAVLATAFLVSGLAAPAHAASDKPPSSTTAKAHKKTSAPKFIHSSSEETTRERERRLLRECRGRPNAGACAGFAS